LGRERRIVVAGGGIPGLALALALRRALGPRLALVVCDPALAAPPRDGRAYAVAAGARRMLDALGAWERVAGDAAPIRAMAITDSRLADPVRPTFLTFAADGGASGEADAAEPFAHMVEGAPLAASLRAACAQAGVVLDPVGVAGAIPRTAAVTVALADGRALEASLLVAADGARSRLREAAGIGWVGRPYAQTGLVATVTHARDHEGTAYEHFLPAGPFAILPLRAGGALGHRASIVWTEGTREAAALLAADAATQRDALAERFGGRLGDLALETPLHGHPLAVGLARRLVGPRLALLGDAAHVIHPVAGQGLNLALAGAAALAETIVDAVRLGLDPGSRDALVAYERARRAPTLAMAAATDGLNRLFSNDALPLRLARDLGLGLVDRMPALKRAFIARAAGLGSNEPKLLRGESL
jgi:2-octaprenyl-6-methoxyphenol hydroxylase